VRIYNETKWGAAVRILYADLIGHEVCLKETFCLAGRVLLASGTRLPNTVVCTGGP
jgi:hypothetical protein